MNKTNHSSTFLNPDRKPTTPPLILVVDDFDDGREMYAAYLQFSGYGVAEAANGIEAVEKTQELLPDIVLMDLALPRMDGWEATRRLKADPGRGTFRSSRSRDTPSPATPRERARQGATHLSPSHACLTRW